MKGGRVLASGTAGCIFKPPLLCQGQKERSVGMVTKLMTTRDAETEYDIIKYFQPIISKIPNNEEYFVLNQITQCKPQTYTEEDLSDFNEKCSALTNQGITKALVESETRKGRIMGLQLPDGGMDLSDYLADNKMDSNKIIEVNNALIKLITKGISPMNKAGIVHNDLKAPNIVYNEHTKSAKIIDWGLADIVKKSQVLPRTNLPLMFNEPFTNLLFYRDSRGYIIKRRFDRFIPELNAIKRVSEVLKTDNLKEKERILTLEIKKWFQSSFFSSVDIAYRAFGSRDVLGHFGYIQRVYFENNSDETINLICSQIAHVLMKFSYDSASNTIKPFDIHGFFQNVFRYNVDIYGLLTYLISLHDIPKLKKSIDIVQDTFLFGVDYLTKPYDIAHVVEGIKLLNGDLAPKKRSSYLGGKSNKTKRKGGRKAKKTKKVKKNKKVSKIA
jgi:serine/threonine protein kinase